MSQIVVPAAARSVITPVQQTTFQVGTYTPLSDTFTKVVDLNDHVSFWLVKVDLPQPQKVYARGSTIRVAGERITAWNYQNRHITLTLQLLYQSGTTALLQAVRSLLSAIENPPYRLAFAPPNASVLTYADVVAVSHTIPSDAKIILAKAISNITIDFECAPGFSGDRITLSNLVVNPGFEAPSGPGVQVFNDTLANANAYAVQAGGAPTVAANVMTIPTGGRVAFGSPAWGAINQWSVRWQATSGTQAAFYLHYTDGSNNLFWQAYYAGLGAASALVQVVGGVAHVLASSTITITAGNWYWLVATQFPAAPGTPPNVLVTIYNDAGGAIGAVLGTFGPVPPFDTVTALSGRPQMIAIGNSLPIGGAFATVHTVTLFGPGGRLFTGSGGTGRASGAWEQNTANTYPGGAVTSYGAARIDLAPAGTALALWQNFQGGAPAGTNAIPAAAGQTLGLSAYVRSAGLAAGAQVQLFVEEYDASGAALRGTAIQTLTGNQASWTQLTGTLTLGASTAYVDVQLVVSDTTSGSANGVVWFDNVQCWNQTTTGQTVMPYCELRFPQSPAQLLLTGLQGDMVAPAAVSMGVYTNYTGTRNFVWMLGSRALPSPKAQLIGSGSAYGGNPQVLSSSAYGGYAMQSPAGNAGAGMEMTAAGASLDALVGRYHLFARALTNNTSYASQTCQATIYEKASTFLGTLVLGSELGNKLPAGTSTAQYTWMDAGAFTLPIAPQIATEDLSLKTILCLVFAVAPASASPTWQWDAMALMPIDGNFLSAALSIGVDNAWVWFYNTPPVSTLLDSGWRFSYENTPTPNPNNAGGGSNTNTTGIQPLADGYVRLDPTQATGANGSSIAQFVSIMADTSGGDVFPSYYEMQYTPLYLYARGS